MTMYFSFASWDGMAWRSGQTSTEGLVLQTSCKCYGELCDPNKKCVEMVRTPSDMQKTATHLTIANKLLSKKQYS